ncbi:NAD(P)/FAD-dependent oxidoreductase [Arthrobacter livingstonensis]|nr:NAD(P)/FAD-dependent oxidoreductase [Arthrobacter livingstonensis]
MFDVLIIGGGPAGLNAALMLGRSRRSVAVIDAGDPRNAAAEGVHGFLTRDGVSPAELGRLGREEVARYGVEVLKATAVAAARTGSGFTVTLDDGRTLDGRRMLVTTGVRDELPDIPGLGAHWGRDVVHCPYCHGWEVRDRSIGVLASSAFATHHALMFRQLSPDVTLFVDSAPQPSGVELQQLQAHGITVVQGRVTEVLAEGGHLSGVMLDDGRSVPLQALAVVPRSVARSAVLDGLGIATVEGPLGMGRIVEADATGLTVVPGLWVAGNIADLGSTVLGSAAAGAKAGAFINMDLVTEEATVVEPAAAR